MESIGQLFFIVGPTASGKTALSLDLAEYLGCEILSCDSLCFYQGMDIGTAKPTVDERQRVFHHGVDLVPVKEVYSVERYLRYSTEILNKVREKGKSLVIVGGSGFYLKGFFSPVTDGIDVSDDVLDRVRQIREEGGLEALVSELKQCCGGLEGIGNLDLANERRVEKALTRCMFTGKCHRDLEAAFKAQGEPFADFKKHVILINRERDELKERNLLRVEKMLDAGLVDEVKRLRSQGLEKNITARRAIGYRETLAYLDDELDFEELRSEIWLHTNQLMRKQRSWFSNQIPIHHQLDGNSASGRSAAKSLFDRLSFSED